MMNKKVSIIVFFLSIVLFCVNLRINFSGDIKTIIFWISIVMMLGIILYQIFYLKNNQFVLFEIILFYFLLHLLYQINYFGLAESDSYKDYDFLKTIINSNYFVINPINSGVSGWPLLHLFTSFITIIIKIDPLIIAKILPSFIESIIAISIYLVVHTLYKNEKAALLSCLIVGTIPTFVSFESFFVRESYALYFLILFFFILYIAKQRDDYRFLALSLFLIPVLVLSHHFTSFMLIILLFIFIVFSKIIPFLFRKNENLNFNKININTVFIILLLATIFYWCYFTPDIWSNFFKIYYEVIGMKEFVTYGQAIGINQVIVTLRGNILFYGFFFFNGVLALILLIVLFLKKQKQIIENVSFTFFLFFCLGLGSVSLFLLGSLIYPDRFLPFGWLFGTIPLSILLFNLKNIKIRKIIVLIIISFLIFNIYNIDPYYYTGKGPLDGRTSEKEYAIATTINISKPYYGYMGVGDAIYDIQRFDFANGGMIYPLTQDDPSTRRLYTFTTKPGNSQPVFGAPSLVNGSTGEQLSLNWSIRISDPEGNAFSWAIQCSNGQGTNGFGASNGTKSLNLSGLTYSTTYNVWVNATNPTGSGLYTRSWYTFTTRGSGNNPPVFTRAPSPANRSTWNPLSLSWRIQIDDLENNSFNWWIQCSNGQVNNSISDTNGIKSLSLSGLAYSTTYKVWVNATDPTGSGLYVRRCYTFTTKRLVNSPPVFGTPSPANGSTGNLSGLTWSIPINDPEGDLISWTIQCSNGQGTNGSGESNGTKSLNLSGLAYSTTYNVWVNATDPTGGLHRYSDLAIIYKDYYLYFLETEKTKSLSSWQKIIAILSCEDSNDINKICDLGDVFISKWNK